MAFTETQKRETAAIIEAIRAVDGLDNGLMMMTLGYAQGLAEAKRTFEAQAKEEAAA